MNVSINQIKKGFAVKINNDIFFIIEKQHVKPGKGGAFVRIKLKNARLGTVIDRTFKPDDKIEVVYIDKKNIQYLYSAGETYEFMDHDTYDQISLHKEQLGEMVNYLKESLEVTALSYNNQIIALEPPIFIDMKIASTEPGVKGDTSKAGSKPAVTETGMKLQVPLFINEGDVIRVDTRTKEYASRV